MVTNFKSDLNEEQLLLLGKLLYGKDYKKTASRKDITGMLEGFIEGMLSLDPESDPEVSFESDPKKPEAVKENVSKSSVVSGVVTQADIDRAIRENPEIADKPRNYIIGWTKGCKRMRWNKK